MSPHDEILEDYIVTDLHGDEVAGIMLLLEEIQDQCNETK